jgi:parallel beta-helix repeat protein
MSRFRKFGVLFAAAVASTLPTIGGAGADVSPVCGQTITSNTTLTADLGPCPNFGLIIGASNITLDLGGHTLSGTPQPLDNAGVYMKGRTGVTVKNGTITAFDAGVAIEGGTANTVSNIRAIDNIGRFSGGVFSNFGDGVAIMSSTNNKILSNVLQNNAPYSGVGIYTLVDSNHPRTTSGPASGNVIDGNDVLSNKLGRDGLTGSNDNDGIRLETNTTGTIITNNRVIDSGLDGIALFVGSADTVIRGNQVLNNGLYRTAARNGDGIMVGRTSDRTVIENNYVRGNGDNGILVRNPAGALPGATLVRVIGNTAVGNAVRPTIPNANFGPAYDLYDRNPDCDSNTWLGNRYHTFNPPCVTTGGQQI